MGCDSLVWSLSGFVTRDHTDHGELKKPVNPIVNYQSKIYKVTLGSERVKKLSLIVD